LASLYRLDVIVRGNSTITQDNAVKWVKNWVNERQEADNNKDSNGNYLREYYADLYDSRSNKSWKVFSDVATKNRVIKNEYICENNETIQGVIFTSPFLVGISAEVVIDNENGIKHININNNNARIFLQVEDSLKAIARVENQDDEGFDIVIYNGEYFDEDKVRLNCKENPVKVNYVILF